MRRNEFLTTALKGGLGCCGLAVLDSAANGPAQAAEPTEADREKEFVKNWMSDLFDSIDAELDEETKVRVMAGCGRGCFRRFSFKQGTSRRQGQRAASRVWLKRTRKNFEVWQEDALVHIRYGAENKQCYCPAAPLPFRPRPHDAHCECTRATAPDDLRNGAGEAGPCRDRRVAATGRQDLPLRGARGVRSGSLRGLALLSEPARRAGETQTGTPAGKLDLPDRAAT